MRQKFENLKIKKRLISAFAALAVIALLLATFGIVSILDARQAEAQLQMRLESMPLVTDAEQEVLSVQSEANAAVLNYKNAEDFQSLSKSLDESSAAYKASHAKLMATVQTDEWKTKLANSMKSYENDYGPKLKSALQLAQTGDVTQATASLKAASTTGDAILKTYTDYMTYRVSVAKSVYNGDKSQSTVFLIMLVAISVLCLAFLAVAAINLTRSITRPLNDLVNSAVEFSKGKLNVRAKYQSENEFGVLAKALNIAFDNLQEVVSEISDLMQGLAAGRCDQEPVRAYLGDFAPISDSANQILDGLNVIFKDIRVSADQEGSGSDQVSNGAQALAQGSTEQASAVEELSASISDVSAKVHQNSKNITEIAVAVEGATNEAGTGNSQMSQMLEAMKAISTSSEEIAKIIQVIDNIAFQTNILALNASVEAAHAGEAGKGFAVVAEEVRNLASKSADAAKQTATLIGNSTEKVKEGMSLAGSTAQTLAEIAKKVQTINSTIREIEAASSAQSMSIAQITQGIDQVSSVVQTNSATAEQSAAASEELSSQAAQLKNELAKIQIRA